MSMSTISSLLDRIRLHCEQRGISPATFGLKTVNDGKLVRRLEGGGTISLRTLERIEAELSSQEPERAA